jgi:hypothetical protein
MAQQEPNLTVAEHSSDVVEREVRIAARPEVKHLIAAATKPMLIAVRMMTAALAIGTRCHVERSETSHCGRKESYDERFDFAEMLHGACPEAAKGSA